MDNNNKRIAKNTMLLYFRMLLMMGVSLYTVRVVLDTLGAVDYGLFNVVGGIVTMFSFLSGTMASASQRFFAFELGKGDYVQLKKTFSMTMTIYLLIGVIILLLAETVGLWFLNTQMTIPSERMEAALWVYQFSIFSFMMTMFTIPYNATIIAHERMNIYAWVSIIEVVLKLVIVYLLVVFSYDKLKVYAVLMFAVTTLVTFIYRTYCKRKFEECSYSFYWDKGLFKEILSYSGWNLIGSLAAICKNQGTNILLNVFFGPIVNTARGIAFQVSGAVTQFVTNFFVAFNPQIIKYYAANEKDKMMNLVFQSAKLSYFLLFILSMPFLLETQFILSIWLKNVPEYTVLFTRLVIINALVDTLSNPLIASAQATGKIKQYQIVVGGILLSIIPISYVFLRLGYPPEVTMYVGIIVAIINVLARLFMLQKMIGLNMLDFLIKVCLNVLIVTLVSYLLPYIIFNYLSVGTMRFFIVGATGLFASVVFVYFIGLSRIEKDAVKKMIFAKLKIKF